MSVIVTTGDLIAAANWNGLSFGTLGYAEVTSNQENINSETDLTGLSVTVSVEASRRIRVTGSGLVRIDSGGEEATGRIKEDSTVLGPWIKVTTSSSTREFKGEGSVVLSPSSGSHTYKLSLERTIGTGDVDLVASATSPAFILVEDIGSA